MSEQEELKDAMEAVREICKVKAELDASEDERNWLRGFLGRAVQESTTPVTLTTTATVAVEAVEIEQLRSKLEAAQDALRWFALFEPGCAPSRPCPVIYEIPQRFHAAIRCAHEAAREAGVIE